MPLAVTEDHQELASSMREWARSLGGPDVARAVEDDPHPSFSEIVKSVEAQGLTTIAVPEALGGGGGSLLDLAVAIEAAAEELVPGPLLGSATAAAVLGRDVGPCGIAVGGDVVYDAGGSDQVLVGESLVSVGDLSVTVEPGVDLTRRAGRVTGTTTVDPLSSPARLTLTTLAAAEASGIATWCLRTAVEYAKVREQFGQPIGKFQAIKHLCAEMLETAELVSAAAWDAASAADAPGDHPDDQQWRFAVDVAGAIAFDGAVRVAQSCIQILGGMGFTFEHDAHLYLRRAIALRGLVGGSDEFALRLTDVVVTGMRRQIHVDLGAEGRDVRARVRPEIADLAAADDRRTALVDSGCLTPHWPAPFGRDASAVEQLVIDEELAAAGIERPELGIGAWAVPTILAHGTDEQRNRFVRPTLLGDISWCQLFSEPGAGSDLASLATRAERTDDGWLLTGQKVWTSLAAEADWAICLARTDPDAPRHRGITYFLVDMSTEGIDVRPLREMTGDALFNEVFLDGVYVPDDCVVGEVNGGWPLARTTLANERVAMASSRLSGSVERAVELASDASLQDRVRVGHAVALATACAQLGARATLRSLAGQGPGPESSVAKLVGVRSRQDASELVVDLHGPTALLDDEQTQADIHEMLLTRCLSIAGGTTQILRNVAAERILGLPR